MALELCLVAALAGGCWWAVARGRGGLQRAARQQLAQATWQDDRGDPVFVGSQARVLQADLTPDGSDETGPFLRARYLCEMPSGRRFEVHLQTAHRRAAGHTTVQPVPGEGVSPSASTG